MMMSTTMMIQKQIHLFLRAPRADSTAFSVYCSPTSVSFFDGSGLSFNNVDGFLLLFHQNAHIVE